MKAVVFHEHGDLDRLVYQQVPKPDIGPHDVLVKVKACALNHLDIWTRIGMPGVSVPMPHILGCDVSGEIEEVGKRTHGIKKGERVVLAPGISCGTCQWCRSGWDSLCTEYKILGFQVNGGYAEYVKAPERNVIRVSNRYPLEEWAACPLVFLTAYHMLVTRAELKKGETVLIHAAGSGVGSAAIQVAKAFGARIATTVGSEGKAKSAKKLGADFVINYRKTDFVGAVREWTRGEGVQVVLEHIGAETFLKSLAALAKKGRLVTCGVTSGPTAQIDLRFLFVRQFTIRGCYMGGRSELEAVMKLLRKGILKPVVDSTFPLSKAREAQQHMLDRKNFGKILLIP